MACHAMEPCHAIVGSICHAMVVFDEIRCRSREQDKALNKGAGNTLTWQAWFSTWVGHKMDQERKKKVHKLKKNNEGWKNRLVI